MCKSIYFPCVAAIFNHIEFEVSEIPTLATTRGIEKVPASLRGAQTAQGGVHRGGQSVAALLKRSFGIYHLQSGCLHFSSTGGESS